MKNRLEYIDKLKGLTIILVVMGHVYYFSMAQSECVAFDIISSFHMPLFMFLSGYVAHKGITSPFWSSGQLFRKIWRLMVPMFVFGVLFTFTFSSIHSVEDILRAVWQFLAAPAKNGYWYLMSLAVIYVFLQIFRINRKNSFGIELLIVSVFAIFCYISSKTFASEIDVFCLTNTARLFPFFAIGMFARKYNWIISLQKSWVFYLSCLTFIIFTLVDIPYHLLDVVCERIVIPLSAILALTFFFSSREEKYTIVDRQLSKIGKYTLEIYVLHSLPDGPCES